MITDFTCCKGKVALISMHKKNHSEEWFLYLKMF